MPLMPPYLLSVFQEEDADPPSREHAELMMAGVAAVQEGMKAAGVWVFFGALTDAARQHPGGVRFGSCNVDDNPRTTALLGITSVPTLMVFDPGGNEASRHVGALPARALDQLLAQLPRT